MTLPPSESRRVTGLKDGQLKFLRKMALNETCSMPECDAPTEDGHHIFARSVIGNDAWVVEIVTDTETIVTPHVTGLCRPHHRDVEEHRAWIRYQGGIFEWYDRAFPAHGETKYDKLEDIDWTLIGKLTPQPGEKPFTTAVKKAKTVKKEGRLKAMYGVRIPADEKENGFDVIEGLVDGFREKYAAEMGWSETCPRYYCIVAALVKGLQ